VTISPAEIDSMTNQQFDRQVFALIVRGFGLGGLARFFRHQRSDTGDDTAERDRWFDAVTHEEIERELLDDSGRQQPRQP
jgi:hypothetical protein